MKLAVTRPQSEFWRSENAKGVGKKTADARQPDGHAEDREENRTQREMSGGGGGLREKKNDDRVHANKRR